MYDVINIGGILIRESIIKKVLPGLQIFDDTGKVCSYQILFADDST